MQPNLLNFLERLTNQDDISSKSSIQEFDSKPDSDNMRFKYDGCAKPTENSVIHDLRDTIMQKDKEIERLQALTKYNSKDGKEDTNSASPNRYSSERKTAEKVEKALAEFNRELREELSEAYMRQQQLEEENYCLKTQIAEQVTSSISFEKGV